MRCTGKFSQRAICGAVLAMLLLFPSAALADQEITPGTPIKVSGTSGGTTNSGDCGYVATVPNHVLNLPEDLTFWQIQVESKGSPTLLVDGPAGRYCVLPDRGKLQFSGYGTQGTYEVYIGDRNQGQHPYQLSISGRQ